MEDDMHPIISRRNDNTQRDGRMAGRRENLRRRLRMGYEGWKRHRMISAMQAVNDHWLRNVGIDRNDIEALVDRVVQREIPVPATASPPRCDQNSWQTAT